MPFSRDLYFVEGNSESFCGLIFAGHQVEYIVSLSHYFFFQGLKFRAQQAYSKICEIYVSQKLPHIRHV